MLNLNEMGQRIRKQRELLGFTREQFAEKIEITPKFCSDIELGIKGMSLITLLKISETLKIGTDYILTGNIADNNLDAIMNMFKTCPEDKLKYAEMILINFLLACS